MQSTCNRIYEDGHATPHRRQETTLGMQAAHARSCPRSQGRNQDSEGEKLNSQGRSRRRGTTKNGNLKFDGTAVST